MPESFDAYHAWLSIPPEEQPPNYYQLLGVRPFEEDPEAIAAAADQRVGRLHAYQAGSLAGVARKLLEEVADAKACLLSPTRKAAYDKGLRQSLQSEAAEAKRSEEVERARTEQFLGVLQQRDLMPPELIAGLRRQASQSKKPVPAEAVAKRLIEAGHLTPSLAKRLLPAGPEQPSAPAGPPPKGPEARPQQPPLQEADEDLELAPLDDRPAPKKTPTVKKAPSQEAAKAPSPDTGVKQPPPPQPAGADSKSLLEEELAPSQPEQAGPSGGSLLDNLMADEGYDAAAAGPLVLTPRRTGWRRLFAPRRRPGRKANVWDSPLLLVGGGILLALVLMLIALVLLLGRQTGDEALKLANEDYRNGAYSQAIYKYNQYLKKFSGHAGNSLARVNRGLAQLRQVTPKGTTDWKAALQVAHKVLDKIHGEEEFKQAQADLSAILLTITQGLAVQAQKNTDPELVKKTREALALMRRNVPDSLLRVREISEVEASLALTEREIARGDRLGKAIDDMQRLVAQGNSQQAYDVRKALLKEYPLLAEDDQLRQALIEVSQAQRHAVDLVQKRQPPQMGEPESPLLADVALVRRTTTANAPDLSGRVVFARAGGSAYGLDATTGKVLWRRFVGSDLTVQGTGFTPTPISAEPAGDVLLVDSVRNELLRVEAGSGSLRWRHPLAEPFDAHPVVAGGRILVATPSGRIVRIDAADGSSSDYIQLPQGLRVAPAVDLRRALIFQVADHSNLFVLSLPDGQCKQVVYLGHEPGSITAPPVIIGRFLLIVVNDRARDSALRVLRIEEEEEGLSLKPVQQVRLEGHVDVPLSVDPQRGRVLLATDRGAVELFDVNDTDAGRPLKVAAEAAAAGDELLARFPLLQADHVWISGAELTKNYIELSRRRLVPKWTGSRSGAGQQPPVAIGRTIFSVQRDFVVPGVLVSAVDMDQNQPLWTTHLAVPLASEPLVDPSGAKITAVTAAGEVYRVDAAGLQSQTILDQPETLPQATPLRGPVGRVVPLEGGLLAMTDGKRSDRIAVFDPTQPQEPFRWLKLPDTLAAGPIAFAGGLLAPCKIGQVFLIDPRSGRQLTQPFQPRLQGGLDVAWRLPAIVGKSEAVLAEGNGKLYRVQIEAQPTPHLVARNQQELSQPIASSLAAGSDVVYAVDRTGTLAVFTLPELTPAKHQYRPLGGRCVWGPRRVGKHVMLATDDDKLLCLDGGGQLAWQIELSDDPLAGTPLETGDQVILASVSGVVWRVDAGSGEELGRIDTGRPLGTGPVRLGQRLLIGGRDGSLVQIERPD